ncbi:MAG: threonine/serine exporter family protein [Muribaculaceae bacterium]|nr:threonine/serine exporter family protein [Muribaculaceae bacterium]
MAERLQTVEIAATDQPCEAPSALKEISLFLSDYASWLLGCGSTCIRLEHNVGRMARAWNCQAVMTILPRHIHMTVNSLDHSQSFTYITATGCNGISFDINSRLSSLSWEVADGRIDFNEARKRFSAITASKAENANTVLLLASLANASFCRLFGGDWPAMSVVFLATLCGMYVKQLMLRRRADLRVTFILCAFISAVLGAGAGLFGLGHTPEIAVATSVLYLVPGIPFLNSFSDMLAGHYICSFSRFIHAVILTCCLSAGLCAGLLTMNLGMF